MEKKARLIPKLGHIVLCEKQAAAEAAGLSFRELPLESIVPGDLLMLRSMQSSVVGFAV